jgi:hypothetical protein
MKIHSKIYNFKQQLINYILIILGGIIFSAYIWLRFIRPRLPKDIPLSLSLLGFLITIELCIIYVYIIIFYLFIHNSNKDSTMSFMINYLYKPLEDFDYFWKHLPIIKVYYNKFIIWLAYKLRFFINKTNIFFIIFGILPRLILISVLYIDIFYFHKFANIYKFIFLGIFLFLNRYIIYSLKMLKKDLIMKFEFYVKTVSTPYVFGVHPSEWPENYDPNDPDNDDFDPNVMMDLPIEIFIDYYINNLLYKNNIIDFCVTMYNHENIYKKYNLEKNSDIPYAICEIYHKDSKDDLKRILDIAEIIENYNITKAKKMFIYTKVFIFTNYLICWLYILIVSTSINNLIDLIDLIMKIASSTEEPFSGLFF